MKFQIMSDLHLEFLSEFETTYRPVISEEADAFILAGDIDKGSTAIPWIRKHFPADKNVFYVLGNHEYYGRGLDLLDRVKRLVFGSKIHVLENNSVIIPQIDGLDIQVIGATLWTDFDLYNNAYGSKREAARGMNDFCRIRNGTHTLTPEDTVNMHTISRAYIEIKSTQSYRTVVVTHHAPSIKSVHPRYIGQALNPAFASNLEHMMGEDWIKLWVHGHMHNTLDYKINGTRVVCNPRGYDPYQLNPEFDDICLAEV